MARSPIEQMIDEACGFDPNAPTRQRELVKLECPICKSEKMVAKDKTDPPNTEGVVYPCPKCLGSGEQLDVSYCDKLGRQIDIDGNVITKQAED